MLLFSGRESRWQTTHAEMMMNRRASELSESEPQTPFFVCDARELRRNCAIVESVRRSSGAHVHFAMKSFTSCGIFRYMAPHFDGVVASSLFESKLGREYFCRHGNRGEVHTYSPGFAPRDFSEILATSNTVIFNSHSQLERFRGAAQARGVSVGLRLNPEISGVRSGCEFANPCSKRSRLGVIRSQLKTNDLEGVSGVLFHVNSENDDLDSLTSVLDGIERRFSDILSRPDIEWVSLGGGISFTDPGYPVAEFVETLKKFADRWDARIFLEPGSAISSSPFTLHTTVLDVVQNEIPTAILDVSAEAHLPDRFYFDYQYPVEGALAGSSDEDGIPHQLGGVSCLSSDALGEYRFREPLRAGDRVVLSGCGDYTMVQQTWFNGVHRPSVYYRHESGEMELIKEHGYEDYLRSYL